MPALANSVYHDQTTINDDVACGLAVKTFVTEYERVLTTDKVKACITHIKNKLNDVSSVCAARMPKSNFSMDDSSMTGWQALVGACCPAHIMESASQG